MKIFRFMSYNEAFKMFAGVDLTNETNHQKENHSRTNSIGFCFLSLKDFKPEYAFHFLIGLNEYDVCVKFEADTKYLKKGKGIFAKPLEEAPKDFKLPKTEEEFQKLCENIWKTAQTIEVTEYSTTFYNNTIFKPIEYCSALDMMSDNWEWRKFKNDNNN